MVKVYVRGDYGFPLSFTAVDSNNSAVDLTTSTIRFKAKLKNAFGAKINNTCAIISAASGTCSCNVGATDFDTSGDYEAELEITYASSVRTAIVEDIRVVDDI